MKNKKSMRKLLSGLLAIVMAACMLMGMATTAGAVNQSVVDARSGVVHIEVCFVDTEVAYTEVLAHGSGFLINERTVITANHVVDFPDEIFLNWQQITNAETGANRTVAEVKECLQIRISVYDDVFINASVVKASANLDYAILSLEQEIGGRTPLAIRNSETLVQTEEVHVLGFPGDLFAIDQLQAYDTNAVAVMSGNVVYVANEDYTTDDGVMHTNVNVVTNSANTAGGASGGPLVDNDGNVVGVHTTSNIEGRAGATSSKELIQVLDALKIEYEKADGDPIIPKPPVPLDPVVDDTTTTLPTIPGPVIDNTTTTAPATTEKEEDPEPEKEGLDPMVIAIAGAAAVVIILIIILIVVSSKKKKAAPAPAPVAAPAPSVPRAAQPQPQPRPQPQPAMPNRVPVTAPARAASPETSLLNAGIGETTVLGAGSGETTVLSQSVNGGVLVRASNNERIPVNTADFTVGRERSRVDYCIGGNTNISREHARFVVRNGHTYIIDNKTANGTFVNGIKARPGQEIELRSGDKIMLADETFEFVK